MRALLLSARTHAARSIRSWATGGPIAPHGPIGEVQSLAPFSISRALWLARREGAASRGGRLLQGGTCFAGRGLRLHDPLRSDQAPRPAAAHGQRRAGPTWSASTTWAAPPPPPPRAGPAACVDARCSCTTGPAWCLHRWASPGRAPGPPMMAFRRHSKSNDPEPSDHQLLLPRSISGQ